MISFTSRISISINSTSFNSTKSIDTTISLKSYYITCKDIEKLIIAIRDQFTFNNNSQKSKLYTLKNYTLILNKEFDSKDIIGFLFTLKIL